MEIRNLMKDELKPVSVTMNSVGLQTASAGQNNSALAVTVCKSTVFVVIETGLGIWNLET